MKFAHNLIFTFGLTAVPSFFGVPFLLAEESTSAPASVPDSVPIPASVPIFLRSEIAAKIQPMMVKIYGAGGFSEMEEYQSGFFISADGLVATAFSPVLNTEELECVLFDGSHLNAKLFGIDPVLEVALLKIEKPGTVFSYFDLQKSADFTQKNTLDGASVLAFSNLFNVAVGNEPVSVQAGNISSTTRLDASRRAFVTRYHGTVYVLDVTTNNPGAAGGALVSADGNILYGILGKELQHTRTGCWLNFAIPAHVLSESVQKILSGDVQTSASAQAQSEERPRPERALRLEEFGLEMVPEIVTRTPTYIDAVHEDSRAARAQLLPDDLILYWNGRLVQSLEDLRAELEFTDYQDPVKITVLRNGEIVEIQAP